MFEPVADTLGYRRLVVSLFGVGYPRLAPLITVDGQLSRTDSQLDRVDRSHLGTADFLSQRPLDQLRRKPGVAVTVSLDRVDGT